MRTPLERSRGVRQTRLFSCFTVLSGDVLEDSEVAVAPMLEITKQMHSA